jgi:HAD superfamily hydrolase (TIGR01450 family)
VLKDSAEPLSQAYDLAMLDLDGVVYIGPDAVPGAVEHLARLRSQLHVAYVTNNASRPPQAVADHLRRLGIEVADEDVVTSAQAAARLVAERVPADSSVFVIGGTGLDVALAEHGLRPVQDRAENPAAVVSGFSADLRWGTVIAGAILVREGLPWVASNTDMTVPTPQGPGPGNGALVDVVATFAQRLPVVAGKPEPPLMEETRRRVGGERPLVVGDRLDTDILGARRVGYDSLLVTTGVTGVAELVAAAHGLRPSFVGTDLGALSRPHQAPVRHDRGFRCGGWWAEVRDGAHEVERAPDTTPARDGGSAASADAWWRVVASSGWEHLDATGRAPDVGRLHPPSTVSASAAAPSDQETA